MTDLRTNLRGANTRMDKVEAYTSSYFLNSSSNGYILLEIEKMRKNFDTVHQDMADMEAGIRSVALQAHDEIQKEVKQVEGNMDIYVQVTNKQLSAESNFVRFQIAGTFTLLACLISILSITSHLRSMTKPDVQRRILAILWMVPIYGITSWLSLVFPVGIHYFTGIRDIYEAYCVYTFVAFLIMVIGEDQGLQGARIKIEKSILLNELENEESIENLSLDDLAHEMEGIVDDQDEIAGGGGGGSGSGSVSPSRGPRSGDSTIGLQYADSNTSVDSLAIGRDGLTPELSRSSGNLQGSTSASPGAALQRRRSLLAAPLAYGAARRSSMATVAAAITGENPKKSLTINPPCSCGYDPKNVQSRAAAILYQDQLCALQFVLLKPILALMPWFLDVTGLDRHYYDTPMFDDKGHPDFASTRMYNHLLLNISVFIAFMGLLNFYHAVERDLAWCDPFPKFVAIKMVVFVTFWQQAALEAMNAAGIVDEESARAAQNLLVCIEMLVASLAFYYIFPVFEWEDNYKKKKQKEFMVVESLALKDFVSDIRDVFGRQAFHGVVNRLDESKSGDPDTPASGSGSSGDGSGSKAAKGGQNIFSTVGRMFGMGSKKVSKSEEGMESMDVGEDGSSSVIAIDHTGEGDLDSASEDGSLAGFREVDPEGQSLLGKSPKSEKLLTQRKNGHGQYES